jgi:hypothetical protein
MTAPIAQIVAWPNSDACQGNSILSHCPIAWAIDINNNSEPAQANPAACLRHASHKPTAAYNRQKNQTRNGSLGMSEP